MLLQHVHAKGASYQPDIKTIINCLAADFKKIQKNMKEYGDEVKD
jgi:hypothetical protein